MTTKKTDNKISNKKVITNKIDKTINTAWNVDTTLKWIDNDGVLLNKIDVINEDGEIEEVLFENNIEQNENKNETTTTIEDDKEYSNKDEEITVLDLDDIQRSKKLEKYNELKSFIFELKNYNKREYDDLIIKAQNEFNILKIELGIKDDVNPLARPL
jgi:hypothetical protein